MKKAISLFLVGASVFTILLTGCGSTKNEEAGTGTINSTLETSVAETSKQTELQYLKKYDSPITLTENMTVGNDTKFLEGDSIENNGYTRWVKDAVGIEWKAKWIAADYDSDKQKLNIAAASNDLPDVVWGRANELGKLAQAGLVIPLDDLISKYGSPLTKYVVDSNVISSKGNLFLPFMRDGKSYAFPLAIDAGAHWKTNWVRKDLLLELGKTAPETLADVEDILAAYHAKYPKGVGFVLNKAPAQDMEFVASAFEAYPKAWIKDSTGMIVYGGVQPEMKKTLEVFAKWYKNGWLDKEYFLKEGDKTFETVTKGNWMFFKGSWWNTGWPFPDMWKNDPKADVQFVPVLKGPEGKSGLVVDTVLDYGVSINVNCKNPEALMYLYNEELDSFYRSDTDEDGKKVHDAMNKLGYKFKYPVTEIQAPQNPDDEKYAWKYNYTTVGYGYFNDFETHDNYTWGFKGKVAEFGTSAFIRLAKAKLANDSSVLSPKEQIDYKNSEMDPKGFAAFAPNIVHWSEYENSPNLHPQMFLGSATKTMIEKKTYIDKLEDEMTVKIITGSAPLDEFDKFCEQWNKNGGEQITQEVNDWYKNAIKK